MKEAVSKVIHQYKYIGIGIMAIFCLEIYLSFHFYCKEPEFPTRLFILDATNGIFRDLLLTGTFIFFQKHMIRVKQVAKDYLPIVVVSILWISISAIIMHALKLVFNTATILSIVTGVTNNILLVLLAGYLYTKWSNGLTKILYFLAYFFTILVFYSDTLYFLVTSTHIEKVVFDNLNIYSIIGVFHATDKMVLTGILVSFFILLLLFCIPQKSKELRTKTTGFAIIAVICIAANFINIVMAETYPKVLYAGGLDEEGEIEKSRNSSRELISKSVSVNLVNQFLRNEERQVLSQYQRVAFSEEEKQLLNELGVKVDKDTSAFKKAFPYERVVVIVAESFHREYLHYYNSRIPAEATQFLDDLLARYPHVDHYYTSNRPTTQGLNSMFLSQVLYSDEQSFGNNATLFKTMENNGYTTLFMDATSQYYNDEFRAYKKRFGMQVYRAKEDLEKQGYTGSTGWGFHNDVMYEETLRILEQNRNNKFLMVTKTIDSHQPYPYSGFSNEAIPSSVKESNNIYLKAIYWENSCLQKFFHDLEERNLMDDKTLIVVTSDHNPHPSQDDNYKSLVQEEQPINIVPIPLIFVSKNLQPFEDFNNATYASQIDFAPTVLGILGIPSPDEFLGRNIISIPEESGYAIGCYDGETLYYRSSEGIVKADMYKESKSAYEKALTHWIQDSYDKYVQGDFVNVVSK